MHGGAKGDGMGAGYFTKVSEKRTEFVRYVVRQSLCPEDMRPGNPPPGAYVSHLPARPHKVLLEVGFSDDRHYFALRGLGLTLLMGACAP